MDFGLKIINISRAYGDIRSKNQSSSMDHYYANVDFSSTPYVLIFIFSSAEIFSYKVKLEFIFNLYFF